jgi:hypothetical protein
MADQYGVEVHVVRPDGSEAVWAVVQTEDERAAMAIAKGMVSYVERGTGVEAERLEDSKP